MPPLFLRRISVIRVYLSMAVTTPDPTRWDPHQPATHKVLGQDFLMVILKIPMYSKNMHNLFLSSRISPVTKVNMSNQDINSNL